MFEMDMTTVAAVAAMAVPVTTPTIPSVEVQILGRSVALLRKRMTLDAVAVSAAQRADESLQAREDYILALRRWSRTWVQWARLPASLKAAARCYHQFGGGGDLVSPLAPRTTSQESAARLRQRTAVAQHWAAVLSELEARA